MNLTPMGKTKWRVTREGFLVGLMLGVAMIAVGKHLPDDTPFREIYVYCFLPPMRPVLAFHPIFQFMIIIVYFGFVVTCLRLAFNSRFWLGIGGLAGLLIFHWISFASWSNALSNEILQAVGWK